MSDQEIIDQINKLFQIANLQTRVEKINKNGVWIKIQDEDVAKIFQVLTQAEPLHQNQIKLTKE